MAGGLHIEMTAFKVIGNWLKKTGLMKMVEQLPSLTPGSQQVASLTLG